ncbi:MAG: lysylphosphatidylglycerol synthase transmembrane domain-containing protein [bacterium]
MIRSILKRTSITLAKLAFIAACFVFIFQRVPCQDVIRQLSSVSPLWLTAAFLAVLAEPVVMALKWRLLLLDKGTPVKISRVVRIVFSSNFMAALIPASLGADAVRVWLMSKERFSLTNAAGSLMADRVLGVLALMTLSLTATLWIGPTLDDRTVVITVVVLAGGMLAVLALALSPLPVLLAPYAQRALGPWLVRHHPQAGRSFNKLLLRLTEIHAAIIDYRLHPRTLAKAMLLNFGVQGLRIISFHCLFRAVHFPVPWLSEIAFIPMIVFLTLMPISFFGLGVKEGAFLYFFGRACVPAPVSLGVSLLSYLLVFVRQVPGAILVLPRFLSSRRSKGK